LQNISKTLAALAAVLILLVSVHGIFIHEHKDNKSEHHVCQLCELGGGLSPFEIPHFTFSLNPFIKTSVFQVYDGRTIVNKTLSNPLRGPPSIFSKII
jgi:hypothetical protein